MADDTTQEIKERLVRIETLLEQRLKSDALERQLLEEKIKLLEEQVKVANNRIKDLEDNQSWTWKAILGAVIGGAIGLLYKFK